MKRKVLVIGLDGTRADLLEHAMSMDKAPNFKRLYTMGKYAPCANINDPLAARAHSGYLNGDGFEWVTAPGWCSVVTGVDNNKHLVKRNALKYQKVFAQTSKRHPTMFKIAKSQGLKTAATGAPCFLTSKKKNGKPVWGIIDMECGLDLNDFPLVTAEDRKTDNLDYRLSHNGFDVARDEKTTIFAIEHILARNVDLLFAHYDTIDHAGHQYGFSLNEEYVAAITNVDALVGKLIDTLTNHTRKHLEEQWMIIVTSDHGGSGFDHEKDSFADTAVPFVINTIEHGRFTSQRLQNLVQPVRHFDVAPTSLKWLHAESKHEFDGQVQAICNYL